jgi:predicted metal-binding membrane protein
VNDLIEKLLRRDRAVVAGGLLLVAALSWTYMFLGAGMGMSGVEMTRHSFMDMDMMGRPDWTPGYVALMFFMWWIMMIAMMLPGATPVILLAAAVNRRASPDRRPYGGSAMFTAGYLLAWAVFSALAVALQWLLVESQLISGMLRSTSTGLSSGLLIVAGAWQFTPWKQACLRHCRSPVEFLTRHRARGNAGALRVGWMHGLFCLGCCWFLMVLLFVGGVMNLVWIAGLALYVWLEKALPAGGTLSRAVGVFLLAWGIYLAFLPIPGITR